MPSGQDRGAGNVGLAFHDAVGGYRRRAATLFSPMSQGK